MKLWLLWIRRWHSLTDLYPFTRSSSFWSPEMKTAEMIAVTDTAALLMHQAFIIVPPLDRVITSVHTLSKQPHVKWPLKQFQPSDFTLTSCFILVEYHSELISEAAKLFSISQISQTRITVRKNICLCKEKCTSRNEKQHVYSNLFWYNLK